MADRWPKWCGAGFSLVELMVVVAVLGIFAAIALPSFKSFVESQRVKSAATDIFIALTRTRSEAIKRDANVTLTSKAGGWQNGWQILDPASGAALDDHGSLLGMTLSGPGSVVYRSSGRIQGAGAPTFSIVGNETGTARCVSADLSGRPNIKEGTC